MDQDPNTQPQAQSEPTSTPTFDAAPQQPAPNSDPTPAAPVFQPTEPVQPQPQVMQEGPQPAQPQPPVQSDDYPGKTLGIVGLVLAILIPLIGLIISIIAKSQSKKAGRDNTPAKIGVIIGAILVGLGVLWILFGIVLMIIAAASGAH